MWKTEFQAKEFASRELCKDSTVLDFNNGRLNTLDTLTNKVLN